MMRFVPTLPENLSFPRRAAAPLLCVFILFYLGFHTLSGERGVVALFKETKKLEALTAELSATRAERVTLEKRIKLMSNSSLDLDMLDEQAKKVLGYAGKDEVVLFTDPQ